MQGFDYSFQKKAKFKRLTTGRPAWNRTTFNLTEIGDTFLDVSTWGKGMVSANDLHSGRARQPVPNRAIRIRW
ncbi:MAG: hypothetical protein WKF66_20925 [Pedobacter sp.]